MYISIYNFPPKTTNATLISFLTFNFSSLPSASRRGPTSTAFRVSSQHFRKLCFRHYYHRWISIIFAGHHFQPPPLAVHMNGIGSITIQICELIYLSTITKIWTRYQYSPFKNIFVIMFSPPPIGVLRMQLNSIGNVTIRLKVPENLRFQISISHFDYLLDATRFLQHPQRFT